MVQEFAIGAFGAIVAFFKAFFGSAATVGQMEHGTEIAFVASMLVFAGVLAVGRAKPKKKSTAKAKTSSADKNTANTLPILHRIQMAVTPAKPKGRKRAKPRIYFPLGSERVPARHVTRSQIVLAGVLNDDLAEIKQFVYGRFGVRANNMTMRLNSRGILTIDLGGHKLSNNTLSRIAVYPWPYTA